MSTSVSQVSLSLLLAVTFISSLLACFITNCPPGGKRSAQITPTITRHSCLRCDMFGDAAAGQCYGPGICCGQGKCIFSQVSQCRLEMARTSPCKPKGVKCTLPTGLQGYCVPHSELCCSGDGCLISPQCVNNTPATSGVHLSQ